MRIQPWKEWRWHCTLDAIQVFAYFVAEIPTFLIRQGKTILLSQTSNCVPQKQVSQMLEADLTSFDKWRCSRTIHWVHDSQGCRWSFQLATRLVDDEALQACRVSPCGCWLCFLWKSSTVQRHAKTHDLETFHWCLERENCARIPSMFVPTLTFLLELSRLAVAEIGISWDICEYSCHAPEIFASEPWHG